jgi:putative ABC transport system substrate-binding protein
VHIAFRWAEGQNSQLPALAADLVERRVGVIVAAGGGPSINAARRERPFDCDTFREAQ